jgi:glycopeptide antibiotics resistance protein
MVQKFARMGVIAWLGVIGWMTLRPLPTVDGSVFFVPFVDTWQQMRDVGDRLALRAAGGNVLLFIPFGVLVAAASARTPKRIWQTVVIGAALSAAIELSQWLVIPGRSPSIDDIILNTTGAAIGGALFVLSEGAARSRRRRLSRQGLGSQP